MSNDISAYFQLEGLRSNVRQTLRNKLKIVRAVYKDYEPLMQITKVDKFERYSKANINNAVQLVERH